MSTQPASTPILTPTYTCQICRQTLSMKGPPIIGEKTEARAARVGQMLAEHMGQQHRDQMNMLVLAGPNLTGWMATEQFRHNDPELAKRSNIFRLTLRQMTKRVEISDEKIEAAVDQLLRLDCFKEFTEDVREKLIQFVTGMRDTLEERQPKAQ